MKSKENELKDTQTKRNFKEFYSKFNNIASYCFFVPLFLLFLSMTISLFVSKKNIGIPMIFNYAIITISSGSMEDAGFEVGEKTIIKRSNPENYSIGDIIAFYDYVDPFCFNPYQVTQTVKPKEKAKVSRIVFHEIVNIIEDIDGKKWFVTKGTNNALPDRNIIYQNYVLGEYQELSDNFVSFVNFTLSIKGALIFVVTPCSIIIFKDCYTLIGLIMELSEENKKEKESKKSSDDENNKEESKNKKEKDEDKTNNKESNKKDNSDNTKKSKKIQETTIKKGTKKIKDSEVKKTNNKKTESENKTDNKKSVNSTKKHNSKKEPN